MFSNENLCSHILAVSSLIKFMNSYGCSIERSYSKWLFNKFSKNLYFSFQVFFLLLYASHKMHCKENFWNWYFWRNFFIGVQEFKTFQFQSFILLWNPILREKLKKSYSTNLHIDYFQIETNFNGNGNSNGH